MKRPGLELHQHLSAKFRCGRFIGEKPSSVSSDSLILTAISLASPLGYRGVGRMRVPRAGLEPAHLGISFESHAESKLALRPFGHRRPGSRTPEIGLEEANQGTARLLSIPSYIRRTTPSILARVRR